MRIMYQVPQHVVLILGSDGYVTFIKREIRHIRRETRHSTRFSSIKRRENNDKAFREHQPFGASIPKTKGNSVLLLDQFSAIKQTLVKKKRDLSM